MGFLFDENVPSKLTFTPSLPAESATTLGESASDTAIKFKEAELKGQKGDILQFYDAVTSSE